MLKCNFRNDSYAFRGRNRRPPKDPVNVILSLAYTFLTREVCSVLEAESFEPYLGFLHGIRYGRKSLALDLVEEFRQPTVDRLVLMLFNKHIRSGYDFDFDEGAKGRKRGLRFIGGFSGTSGGRACNAENNVPHNMETCGAALQDGTDETEENSHVDTEVSVCQKFRLKNQSE